MWSKVLIDFFSLHLQGEWEKNMSGNVQLRLVY